MVDDQKLAELEATAREVRYHIVRMMGANKTHHFGGSLSIVELVTALYFYKMRYDPSDPQVGRARSVRHEQRAHSSDPIRCPG